MRLENYFCRLTNKLNEKKNQYGRYSYFYNQSKKSRRAIVQQLDYRTGNGHIYTGFIGEIKSDQNGLSNIKNFSKEEIIQIIDKAMEFLSKP